MKGNDKEKLTPNQEKALPLFATNTSILEIARQAKINPKTIYEWLKIDAFKSAVERLRNATFDEAMATIKNTTLSAVKTLAGLLKSDDERIKLAAAKEVLGFAFKSKEILEVEPRLQALEEIANEKP